PTPAVEPGSTPNARTTALPPSLTRPLWVRPYIDERNPSQTQPRRDILFFTDRRPAKPHHRKIALLSPTAEFIPKTVETA
ncbi:secretion protein HlyD, partial [Salmonella enterica]